MAGGHGSGHFVPNPNFERDLFRSAEITDLVYAAGERVLAEAERNAEAGADSGGFAESLSKRDHRSRSGRPVSTISADDPGALSIEFGTRHTPPHRFLGRALDVIRR
jgi:hypothetical protein